MLFPAHLGAALRILIAGSTGLLGSHLATLLSDSGHEVIGIRHERTPQVDKEGIRYIYADLRSLTECESSTRDIDIVFLCAAVKGGVSIAKGLTSPVLDTLQINANLLDASAKQGVKRVVLASSTTVYPAGVSPFAESEGFVNDPCYEYFGIGWTNRYIEKLAAYYCSTFDLDVSCARLSSLYGPFDDFSSERAHVIPALIRRFINAEDVIHVWGDSDQRRDFIFAADAATLLVKLALTDRRGITVNIGSGVTTSIGDLASKVASATRRHDVRIAFDPGKPSGPSIRAIDTTLAAKVLGPFSFRSLDAGLSETVTWFLENEGRGKNEFGV